MTANSAELTTQLLGNALDSMPEAIAIFDRDDRFVYWNRCFKKLYGGSNDLCAGTNFADFVRARALAGAVPHAVGREEEWIAGRLARF